MVSRRKRAQSSVGTRMDTLNSKVTRIERKETSTAVDETAAVTPSSASVGNDEMGAISVVVTDGSLNFKSEGPVMINEEVIASIPVADLEDGSVPTWSDDDNRYIAGTGSSAGATGPTPNTLALRDGSGQLKAADGYMPDDVVNKGQLDEAVVPLTVSTSAPSSPSLGDLWVDIS